MLVVNDVHAVDEDGKTHKITLKEAHSIESLVVATFQRQTTHQLDQNSTSLTGVGRVLQCTVHAELRRTVNCACTMQRLALLAAAVQTTALQRPPVVKRVEVEVTRQLDGVSPEHAREAWLDYSWTSGGGIPALVLREPADAKLP